MLILSKATSVRLNMATIEERRFNESFGSEVERLGNLIVVSAKSSVRRSMAYHFYELTVEHHLGCVGMPSSPFTANELATNQLKRAMSSLCHETVVRDFTLKPSVAGRQESKIFAIQGDLIPVHPTNTNQYRKAFFRILDEKMP